MTENHLDQEFSQELSSRLQQQEEILWTGSPDLEKLEQLEPSTFEYFVDVFENIQFIGLIFLLFIGCLMTNADWETFAFVLVIYIALQFSFNSMNKLNAKEIKYAFSNQRLFFKLWKKKKSTIHCIDLMKISKISFEIEPHDIGTIHFMTHLDLGLSTNELISGEERHHLTFELQSDVIELRNRIEHLRRQRIIAPSEKSYFS